MAANFLQDDSFWEKIRERIKPEFIRVGEMPGWRHLEEIRRVCRIGVKRPLHLLVYGTLLLVDPGICGIW